MYPSKQGVSAESAADVGEEQEPHSSPRRDSSFPQGAGGSNESPSTPAATLEPLTSDDVRARASSVGLNSSTIACRPQSPQMLSMTSPRSGGKQSEMEPVGQPSEGVGFDEGGGERKRKLTEAAEASSQSRSRKSSRRISERLEQHELQEMQPIHEEQLTETIEGEQVLEEVAHDEMHAVSSQYMQPLLSRPLDSSMGVARTRGMHVISGHDDRMLDGQLVEEEEEQEIEEMVVYDEEGNMLVGYEGDEMAHEEVIEEGAEEEGLIGQEEEGDDDDDQPPHLEPEVGPEEMIMREEMMDDGYEDEPGYMRSPGGGDAYFQDPDDEDDMYADDDVIDQGGMGMPMADADAVPLPSRDVRTIEFNFLDNKHVCCGVCGEIVVYDSLLREHLPMNHPEVYGDMGTMDLEEISYDTWLKEKLNHERKMDSGFRTFLVPGVYEEPGQRNHQGVSTLVSGVGGSITMVKRRIVSQVRVNPSTMSLAQLTVALQRKMVEKMGRRVKVSLVDKQHARCGLCNAVVSLNKKFEIVHLVRHFNAWHPSSHRCAGTWPDRAPLVGTGKPLSGLDFATTDVSLDAHENLQCIWCGMFTDRSTLAMHFHEVHPEDVQVPKCHLCVQEVMINARLLEKYGEDFGITLPDEHHFRCEKVRGGTFSSEAALDRAIDRRLRRMQAVASGQQVVQEEVEEVQDEEEEEQDEANMPKNVQYANSRMKFGRGKRPKRTFIMPSLRQAIPQDSEYVEALSEGQWRCKMCNERILAAVISAGVIKHYRQQHPQQLEGMQYELCKARLERVSDGCMEFVHPKLIECLICNMTYALHKPYNMCRAIRHLKVKHPEMMPEHNNNGDTQPPGTVVVGGKKDNTHHKEAGNEPPRPTALVEIGEYVEDPEIIKQLKQEYDIDFEKVRTMYGPDGQPFFVLLPAGQEVDPQVAENIQASLLEMDQQGVGGEEETVMMEEEVEEYQMRDALDAYCERSSLSAAS